MGLFEQVQKLAQYGVYSIDLDRLLQDNFDYNLLLTSLPEIFFGESSNIDKNWNFKGAVCADFGHPGVIYGYTFPHQIRFHPSDHLPVKLGKTDQSDPVRDRIWDQTAPDYPQLLFMVTVPNTKVVEDALKAYYKPFQREEALGDEWFNISPSDAIEIALWMSVLASMNNLSSGELIELSRFRCNEPLLSRIDRLNRLQEVRSALKSIDPYFNAQGTDFKLGEVKGRGLKCIGRPEPLTQEKYAVKVPMDDWRLKVLNPFVPVPQSLSSP